MENVTLIILAIAVACLAKQYSVLHEKIVDMSFEIEMLKRQLQEVCNTMNRKISNTDGTE